MEAIQLYFENGQMTTWHFNYGPKMIDKNLFTKYLGCLMYIFLFIYKIDNFSCLIQWLMVELHNVSTISPEV